MTSKETSNSTPIPTSPRQTLFEPHDPNDPDYALYMKNNKAQKI